MTLLNAPAYNPGKERRQRTLILSAITLVLIGLALFGLYKIDKPWQLWHFGQEQRLNAFLVTVEQGDMNKAFGQWNNDPDWQQHPAQYKDYPIDRFTKDWGPRSDYGVIHSHDIFIGARVGNGAIFGVNFNGGKTPLFLRVDDKSKTIGFSPVDLYTGP